MDINGNDKEWKLFHKISAFCVFLAFFIMLAEIFITALPDGARVQLSAKELLEMYNRNWFMGMRYMGLMNIFATTLMIPVFLSFFAIHKKSNKEFAICSLVICLLSYTIFMSDNVSFPILNLSKKYLITNLESEKVMIISAAEALIAKGASHTPGTFPGFLLAQIGSILFCTLMVVGKKFRKKTGIIGIIAFTFLLIFEVLSSFISSLYNQAMIFAMIGGISALTWYIFVGFELLRFAKSEVK
jgi:hypothetical protein